MINPTKPRKNRGEVASLAIAKIKSIPIFLTDERDLQPIIDKILNNGFNDISCIRIVDIIEKMKLGKINGYSRKQGKAIWIAAGKRKDIFDNQIWPL